MKHEMKDSPDFDAVQLAQNIDFIRWVESGQKDVDLRDKWSPLLIHHPDKTKVVDEAIQIITAVIKERQYFLHDSKQEEIWSRIENSIAPERRVIRFSKSAWYGLAASFALIVVVSVVFLIVPEEVRFRARDISKNRPAAGTPLVKYRNESDKSHTLTLDDGSVITLQPNSVVEYPETFTGPSRDVYLSGEAFFEVKRNPKKPFSVYANEIVTRVLGTSFTVRAYKKEKNVVVAVKTGKVSVFTKEESRLKKDSLHILAGTLLTPNQQIVFSRAEARMVKSLVEAPVSLPSVVGKENFEFIDTPAHEVFARLERAYGVKIIFDEEVMSDCLLNTSSLENISFYDKLRLICKGINAKYEILDANVIITGYGCK